ncbi:MAG TPA: OmpA family protein [Xanthobacteraceae bacterium]
MRSFSLPISLIAFMLAAGASPAAAAVSCEPLVQAIEQARAAGDLDRLARLHATVADPASHCSDLAIACIGRRVAIGFVQQAYARANAGAKLDEIAGLLQRGRRFGAPWQLLVAQGDDEFGRAGAGNANAYTAAAHNYEMAINDLAEGSVCAEYNEPPAPPPSQIAALHKKMEEAKLLAPSFELVRTRDNECGGVFLRNVRGFEPTSTPVPIEFEYNATSFTQKGRQAVAALLECARPYHRIHLTGHTDRIGSDGFNMDLSARRLAAVKGFLVSGGYKGIIELEPKGKRDPFVVDDPTQHSEAEIDQMNRRVELRGATE